MDLATRLVMLLEVHQQGSFAKAAELRGIDRSVLSKQIKKLEDSLGLRLLNRSTRSLSFTTAGLEIVKQAQKIRDTLDETHHLANTFNEEPRGVLRLSSTQLFGRTYLKKAVIKFLKKYSQVSIEVILDDRKVDLISDRFDIAFRIGIPDDSNLVAKKLADHKMAILASKDFIEEHGYPENPEQLAALPSVIYSNRSFTLDKVKLFSETEDETFTLNAQGRYRVNEVELLMDAAQEGLGYVIVGQMMLTKNIDDLGLIKLLPDFQVSFTGGLYALYSHRNPPPLVKLFIETVQDTIGTPPVWESYLND
ncbi:LysR family transcriptional regulator [Vibrio diazotrophicus]|jgi:DNA-binding transcriptional LysR family regulator|uniref:LysR family transcriptional regulator n=1 Tax=Vibrio diazotrophicus TaxID=685 RepID=A0A2J8HYU2_VIBDI|nr:LysR family transcriptional regulator [Vibrio diazotrophicus]PNH82023.1 LysR family transcriptional regulator [Vibrio diazotrophicus]PNH91757.1 LysR family transcriptional regulator [Vibrio diazotrophicus]PNI03428.1 LysR family transcriptional regulator [Vibrio diazotrophicus]RAS60998.1 LysR family transcriptional regulator [Vibrio diazotrophicus]